MSKEVKVLIVIGTMMIILGIISMYIDMELDSQCNQLTPNDSYKSTICEKYWK